MAGVAETISFGSINVNISNQNSGVFIGDISLSGADANGKNNVGYNGIDGHRNVEWNIVNLVIDDFEMADSVMFDADYKPGWAHNR